MTPIDAISYGLKAGMVFGQAQTIWATRLIEMQGFWMGFPGTVSDLPKSVTSKAVEPLPLVTELNIEALAETPPAAVDAPADPAPTFAPATESQQLDAADNGSAIILTPLPEPTVEVAPAPTPFAETPVEVPATEAAPAPVLSVETTTPAALALKPIPRRATPKPPLAE
ncbi:superantigen-like protein SSL4 [Fuscibacter oryzae]|uniref:Uncharacterized protein n=1 Tax=Fuscibacter oryzae TaxID=2803939 RepID=A0A8J7MWR8_9RHOB|nr:hypothetical protein [Fuscibacter oryzae]MBL4929164.1 hypothetical protein [Fuscibacter oryzae]